MRTMPPKSRPISGTGSPSRSVLVAVNGRLRLRHGHDEANGGEDVADADALGLVGDLAHRLAGVVDLPRQLPAALLRATDGLHELLDHFLEGVAVAVVEDGHPGRGDRDLGTLEVLDVGSLDRTAKPCRPLRVIGGDVVGTGGGVLEGGRRRLHLADRELAHGGDDGRGRGGERSDHEDLAYALQGRLVTSLTNGAARLQEPMGAGRLIVAGPGGDPYSGAGRGVALRWHRTEVGRKEEDVARNALPVSWCCGMAESVCSSLRRCEESRAATVSGR